MSFLTGTNTEIIYSWGGGGSALSNTTTATVISPSSSTNEGPIIPANFFLNPTYGTFRALRIVARGSVSTAASAQGTLTLKLFADTTPGTVSGSTGLLAQTGGFTPTASLSSAIWEIEIDVVLTSIGTAGVWLGMGQMQISATATIGGTYGIGANSLPATGLALSTQVAYGIDLQAAWGSASASNSITCNQYFVYGLN